MIKLEGKERSSIAPFFKDYAIWRTLIDLVLYGNMGFAIADNYDPQVAALFFSGAVIYGGNAGSEAAADIVRQFPFQPMVLGSDPEWYRYLKSCKFTQTVEQKRFYYPSKHLDYEKIRFLSKIDVPGYSIRKIEARDDEELSTRLGWEHQRYHFKDLGQFVTDGGGYCAVRDERICAAVSCFARYKHEAEIQVTTQADHRRKGLARSLAARFLLDCKDHGIDCPWDASNESSANLAKTLGYLECQEYPVLEIQV